MKIAAYLALGLVLFGSWSGCTNNKQQNTKRTVAVSILPQKYFVDQIAGNRYNVLVMVPQGSSPETYEPTAFQLTELSHAMVYFRLGNLDFENTMLRGITDNFPNLKVVDCSKGIDLIRGDELEGSDDNHHQGVDPHIWISPKTVKVIAQTMVNALMEADPDYADSLKAGYTKFISTIDSLDKMMANAVAQHHIKAVMDFHPVLSYLARDYGFNQIAIESDGKEPSPKQMKSTIDIAKTNGIKSIFVQQEFDTERATIIANEVGASVVKLNPLGYNWDKNIRNIIGQFEQVNNVEQHAR
ncbi:MAG TPA: zinc ABC transporter substrate-binding protein [Williamwhitmania sp.]|nr:zinc ABC transporter substrate-binding protein [Williamwhitmania sp.]